MNRFALSLFASILALSLLCGSLLTTAYASNADLSRYLRSTNRLEIQAHKSRSCHQSSLVDASTSHLNVYKEAYDNTVKAMGGDSSRVGAFKSEFDKRFAVFEAALRGDGYFAIIQTDSYSAKSFTYVAVSKQDYHSSLVRGRFLSISAKPPAKLSTITVGYPAGCTPTIHLVIDSQTNNYSTQSTYEAGYRSQDHVERVFATNFPIAYPPDYQGEKIPTYVLPSTDPKKHWSGDYQPPKYDSCDAINVACHLGNLFKFVVGFPGMLVDVLKFLFLPDFSIITSSLSSMFDSVKRGLGFLAYPIDATGLLFSRMMSNLQHDTFCAWSAHAGWNINSMLDFNTSSTYTLVGQYSFFGATFRPFSSLCYVESTYPLLFKVARTFAQVIVISALLFTMRRKLFNFLKGEFS